MRSGNEIGSLVSMMVMASSGIGNSLGLRGPCRYCKVSLEQRSSVSNFLEFFDTNL